jgi:Peptidase A4 family
MSPLRYLVVSSSAAVLVGTLTLAAGSTATGAAPARTGHVAYSARFISAAKAALVRYLRRGHPQLMLAGHAHAGPIGTTAIASFNWSGYADGANTTPAGTFTRVGGSWTAPSVACGAEDQLTVEWVGLDGLFSGSVEQLGTIGWCYKRLPIYFTWWEMFPTNNGLTQVGSTLQPGDKITASVTRSGTSYTLNLKDATHPANSFKTIQTCAATTCLDTSAEWISERPAFAQVGFAPQAHYNAFKITNGSQTANGTSGTIASFSTVYAITMVDATNAYSLNTVSSLARGNSFSTAWQNSW